MNTSYKMGMSLWLCMLSGCAPLLRVFPEDEQVKSSQDPAERFAKWCDKGVRVACVDEAYTRLRQDRRNIAARESLEQFCEQGQSSACYYLTQFGDDTYEDEACALGELRSCYLHTLARNRNREPLPCEDKERFLEGQTGVSAQRKRITALFDRRYDRDARTAIRYCYKRKVAGLSRENQNLTGVTYIQIHFPKQGSDSRVDLMCDSFVDAEIGQCALDVIEATSWDELSAWMDHESPFSILLEARESDEHWR